MTTTRTLLSPYLQKVHDTLTASLMAMDSSVNDADDANDTTKNKIASFPIRPLVEGYSSTDASASIDSDANAKLVAKTTIPHGNDHDHCLVETSSNSVRCSFLFKKSSDPLERAIWNKYIAHFHKHSGKYLILRRKPVEGYSTSFLILNEHLASLPVPRIVDTIVHFVQAIDRECNAVKLDLNAQTRMVATEFLKTF